MSDDNNSHLQLCSICLEESPNVSAPCGFAEARFHFHCIEKLKEIQGIRFRCPHCNQEMQTAYNRCWLDEIWALEHLSELLKGWLLIPGIWVKKPIFVKVQYGMQRGEKEKRVLRCVVASFVGQLKSAIKPIGGVRVLSLSSNHDTSSKKTFICRDNDNLHEFCIVLRRVAFIESMGRVSCDGYSLSGCRRKTSNATITTA